MGSRHVARRATAECFDFAIVGGGIAGCTIAFELAKRGLSVILLEQGSIAARASGCNTGTLLNQAEPEVVEMMGRSVEMYSELASGPVNFHFKPFDQLLLANDLAHFDAVRCRAEAISAFGIHVEAVDAAALRKDLPQLRDDLPGGYILEGAWMLDAEAATIAMAEAARTAGAVIRTGVRVGQLSLGACGIEGVFTDQGAVVSSAVILASGAWIPDLLPGAPVTPARGWLLRTCVLPFAVPWIIEEITWPDQDRLGRLTLFPTLLDLANESHGKSAVEAFVLAPLPAGDALVGASLASSLTNPLEGSDMPRRLSQRALSFAPGMSTVQIVKAWSGLRPMAPDGLPMVGATPIAGLYLHGGHGSLGMQAAPATARWLATWLADGESSIELTRLDPMRFESVKNGLTANSPQKAVAN